MRTNQIICGESTNVLADFPAASVDLVVTDPPYLVRYQDRDGRRVKNDDSPEAVLGVFDEIHRVLKNDRYCITFCGWSAIAAFSGKWQTLGFAVVGHIVWAKDYSSRVGHTQYRHESAYVLTKGRPAKPCRPISDVQQWRYTGNRLHPTKRAVEVIEPLIQAFSMPGDVVLDPFSGSGSAAVAAALNKRRYLGVELEACYCELAQRRLSGVGRFLEARAMAG